VCKKSLPDNILSPFSHTLIHIQAKLTVKLNISTASWKWYWGGQWFKPLEVMGGGGGVSYRGKTETKQRLCPIVAVSLREEHICSIDLNELQILFHLCILKKDLAKPPC
jgi:hypothetical protein